MRLKIITGGVDVVVTRALQLRNDPMVGRRRTKTPMTSVPDQTTQRPSRNAVPGRHLNLLPREVRRGAPGTSNADQVGIER
jgi:hypothetical protein